MNIDYIFGFIPVTVNPLCPTNKIAPHKRFAAWDQSRGRTFGLFYHLLAPSYNNNYQYDPPDDLQEQPQSDDADDCGEIDDYDENDLSSVTYPQYQRRKEYGNKNFGYYGGQNRPHLETTTRTPRPHYNPLSPYWSGGYFGNNNYRPPSSHKPSDRVKPVNENRPEFQTIYDPQVVGGPLGHVVGFTPVRPTRGGEGLGNTNVEDGNPYLEVLGRCPLAQESVHGYFEVRPGAHMFYWFYYADGTKVDSYHKPFIIWIQGGPGLAASGLGNFAELGPINMDMKPRNHTWVKGRNLLLLDHPVGTGFSYVNNSTLYVKSDKQLAIDLFRALRRFFKKFAEFQSTPTYLFGQSYGGKTCPRLGLYLYTAIRRQKLKMNFKGIGIGGGWVSPKESMSAQPQFLYHTGAIDQALFLESTALVKDFKKAFELKNYTAVSLLDTKLYQTFNKDYFINFNKVNSPNPYLALEKLNFDVNKYVKPTLKVNQTLKWKYISNDAYYSLQTHFLRPTTSFLETLLNNTDLKIVVYNGNLDAVTPLAGASNWVHKLKWPGAAGFARTKRQKIHGNSNGFYKEFKQLSFWSVFGAGHWVPEENPEAMEQILQYMTGTSIFKLIKGLNFNTLFIKNTNNSFQKL
ncbi:hypothetical protein K1T71_006657 [Dendrolimus kikuchii]|uniref:Uncharacterized protein n=1 Tax=Dendrolimus kikuchii TaxID=765133 RepID=A0ACC1D1G0_9NEOP|nr:hypothetical protein K1T71_006657 [Dendrolimus kikuchii]